MKSIKVKVCCISSLKEANLAISAGADAIGLVGPMPGGPGVISNELIREIIKQIPAYIDTFLLTSETEADKIIEHHKKTGSSTIQLVDQLVKESYKQIRLALPGVKIVQVIHVLDENDVTFAKSIEKDVDAILLDSGNPKLEAKELGGTGRTHDWNMSRQIVAASSIPVYLAGGLNASNANEAISQVGPFGLDLCSGVRTNGKLDQAKLNMFFAKIK